MNLMQDVIQTLDAPIKSFRIFALEKAIQEGSSKELLEALRKRQLEEPDEECLILLSHAVVAVNSRISASKSADFTDSSIENFCNTFSLAIPAEKLNIVNSLDSGQIREFASCVPELVSLENNPVIMALLIRKFGSHWPEAKLDSLKQILLSNFLSARLSALEVLTSRRPELLLQDLPQLLSSNDPRIRALAIQGLSRIDMDCSIEHLETMLMSVNPDEKFCGLQNCLYLPFEKIKFLLIKFLASEMSPTLLEKAGLLFQINADQEIPYRLTELIHRARTPRLEVLQKIFSGACKAIEDSGILGNDFPSYIGRLELFGKKTAASRYINEILSKLSSFTSDQEFEEEFSRLRDLNNPELINALKESLNWNISQSLKEKVRDLLENIEKQIHSGKITEEALALEKLSREEMVRVFASWPHEDCEKIKPVIESVILKRDSPAYLRASAFRAALRLKLNGFISQAEPFLKSPDEKLTVAAFEYVAYFEPDKIFPLLGYYLQSQSIRIKSAAIAIFKRFDSNRALSSLKALLSGRNPEQQKLAIFCMVQFDFPLVKNLLVDFLMKNHDSQLLDLGLCLFQSNPDPENLYDLFRLGKILPFQFSEKIADTRKHTEKNLIELGLIKNGQPELLFKEFSERFARDENKAKYVTKPYSVQEIQKRGLQNIDSQRFAQASNTSLLKELFTQTEFLGEEIIGKSWKKYSVIGILIIFAMFALLEKISQNPTKTPNRPKALIGKRKDMVGKVQGIEKENGGILIKSNDGINYLLLPPKKSNFGLIPGDAIKASLIPFRLNDKGVIIVQDFKLEKILSESKNK